MKELKKILVPTNFSNASFNALKYAIEIAQICEAKIILLHAYRLIPHISNNLNIQGFRKDLEYDIQSQFNKKLIQIERNNNVEIDCISQIGFPEDAIESYITNESVEFIIMGVSNFALYNELFRGVVNSVITRTRLPIFTIPEDTSFKKWKRILLTQEHTSLDDSKMIHHLMSRFGSEIIVTELFDEDMKPFTSNGLTYKSNDLLLIRLNEYFDIKNKVEKNNPFQEQKLVSPLLIA